MTERETTVDVLVDLAKQRVEVRCVDIYGAITQLFMSGQGAVDLAKRLKRAAAALK